MRSTPKQQILQMLLSLEKIFQEEGKRVNKQARVFPGNFTLKSWTPNDLLK